MLLQEMSMEELENSISKEKEQLDTMIETLGTEDPRVLNQSERVDMLVAEKIKRAARVDQTREYSFKKFVNNEVIAFVNQFHLEKLSLEDGNGDKVKLVRDKNNNLNVETTIRDLM